MLYGGNNENIFSHTKKNLLFLPIGNMAAVQNLYLGCEAKAPVVQRLDNTIHRINHYPADSVVCFVNTYPLDSDLSSG